MNRAQRRRHVVTWLMLVPVLVVLTLVAVLGRPLPADGVQSAHVSEATP